MLMMELTDVESARVVLRLQVSTPKGWWPGDFGINLVDPVPVSGISTFQIEERGRPLFQKGLKGYVFDARDPIGFKLEGGSLCFHPEAK